MTPNRQIAGASGPRLWTTDLFVPRYRAAEIGAWRIDPGGQLVHDWGYHSGPCLVEMGPSLARRVKPEQGGDGDLWETWMSLTPHEIESQELGCRHAFGHTVVMGLGMGWAAANIALNPNVTQVTVVEIDPVVIDLLARSGALESLPQPARKKTTIVEADAMEWRPASGKPVDFLHADIWARLAEASALKQVRRMQANVQADRIYFWGQEIAIHCAARQYAPGVLTMTAQHVQDAVDQVVRLPLLLPTDRDYPQMIERVIQNRGNRRLRIDVELS